MSVSVTAKKAQAETLALFISDLHLQQSMPHTTQAFFDFLRGPALRTQQLYLLGDLFEYWAGDDDLATPFNRQIIDAIRAVHNADVAVFWIAGNRDFLVGSDFAEATGTTLLPDPFVTTIAGRRLVLTHGDALCTDDAAYIAFRTQVRQQAWQDAFLALPLTQRKTIIEDLRRDSRAAQTTKSSAIMDANIDAIKALFESTGTDLMIHGHTHRPARHEHNGASWLRYVLPDWDCDVVPPRGGWLAMRADGSTEQINLRQSA